MKSKNLIIELGKKLIKKELSLENAIKKLLSFSINENAIKESITFIEDLIKKNPSQALEFAYFIFEFSKKSHKMLGETSLLLADLYKKNQKFDLALTLYDKAKKIFKQSQKYIKVATCDLEKANLYVDLEKFEEAMELYDKAENIFKEQKQWTEVGRCKLNRGTVYYTIQKFNDAIASYDEAEKIFEKDEDWLNVASCNFNKAAVYNNLYRYEEAITIYDKTEKIFKEQEQWIDVAGCYLNKAIIYRNLQKFDTAIQFYDKAQEIFKKQKQWLNIASCHLNKANLYVTLNKFDKAIGLYDDAQKIFKKTGQWINFAKCYTGKAAASIELQKFNEAISFCEEAEKIFIKFDLKLNIASSYLNKAIAYKNLQKYDKAIELYHKSEEIFKKSKKFIDIARCDLGKANISLDLQKFEEALILFNKGRETFKKYKEWLSVARCNVGVANVYFDIQQFDKARENYDEAREIFEKFNMWIDIAGCDLNKANIYFYLQKYNEALELYDKVIKIFSNYNLQLDIATCNLGKGNTYLYLQKYNKAIDIFEEAQNVFEDFGQFIDAAKCELGKAHAFLNLHQINKNVHSQFVESNIKTLQNKKKIYSSFLGQIFYVKGQKLSNIRVLKTIEQVFGIYFFTFWECTLGKAIDLFNKVKVIASRIPEIEWKCFNGLGDVYKVMEDYEEAIKYYEEAIEIIEKKTLSSLSYLDFKTSLREKGLFVYEALIECLLKTENFNKALEYLEKTKSRNLIELMSKTETSPRATEDIVEKDKIFKLKLSSLQFILSQEKSPGKRKEILTEFEETKEDFLNFVEHIKRTSDPLYEPFYEVKSINFKDIQSLIKDNETALIEFFLSSDISCAFIVKNKLPLHMVTLNSTFKELYEIIYEYLLLYRNLRKSFTKGALLIWKNKIKKILSLLYEKIFSNIECKLSNIKKIIFIPHNILFLIPLHAMYKKINGKDKYLIDTYNISYSPSSQILKMCVEKKRSEKYSLFSFFSDTEGNITEHIKKEAEDIEGLFLKEKVFKETLFL